MVKGKKYLLLEVSPQTRVIDTYGSRDAACEVAKERGISFQILELTYEGKGKLIGITKAGNLLR